MKIFEKGFSMAHLPMFYSIDNKRVLIIGAGDVASRKLDKLLEFTCNITIISPIISKSINIKSNECNIKIIKREYEVGDIRDFDIVISAIDNLNLQKDIYFECKKEKILCNCVDLQEYCDFIFPSYIKEGDLTIAISTSGSSPAFAKSLKKYLKELIPNDISNFLMEMKGLRETLPKGKKRMKFLDQKVKEYIKSWN